jgi:hypothetical protein
MRRVGLLKKLEKTASKIERAISKKRRKKGKKEIDYK